MGILGIRSVLDRRCWGSGRLGVQILELLLKGVVSAFLSENGILAFLPETFTFKCGIVSLFACGRATITVGVKGIEVKR